MTVPPPGPEWIEDHMAIKFSLPQSELSRAAQTVNQAVPTRSTLPALMNIHLEVEGEELRLTATDLDTSVTLRVPCEDAAPGRTLVPARLFTDLVKSLPPDLVTVASEGETVSIASKGGEFSLPTADPDDYPQLPKLEHERRLKLPTSAFSGLVRKVVDFVSPEDNRPDLNGVLVEFRGPDLRMVATNGHLMAVGGVSGDFAKGDSVIVLPSALQYAVGGLKAVDEIELEIARTQIVFEIGNLTVYSRLLESTFPKYEDVIPTKNSKLLVARRDELLQALRRVDIVADNITHQIQLTLDPGSLTLSAQQTVGGGRANVKIEAQYDADPMEIGFNAKYLMNILRTIETEEVELSFETPLSAALIKPSPESKGQHHVCLIMPLRLPKSMSTAGSS